MHIHTQLTICSGEHSIPITMIDNVLVTQRADSSVIGRRAGPDQVTSRYGSITQLTPFHPQVPHL
jgi:hypothetical protein